MSRWWFPFIIVVVVIVAYGNSFPGAFHFDDFPLMLENPLVSGGQYDYGTFLELYGGRPLTLWSFYLNLQLAGDDPFWFHLVGVVLHALTGLLLYFFAARYLAPLTAVGAALIFVLHPAQAQAVNYVWSRSLLLMAVFVLAALLARKRLPWLALLFFQLALFSRVEALAAILPLFLLEKKRWKDLVLLGLLNSAAFAAGYLRYRPMEIGPGHSDPLGYLLSAPAVFWKYMAQMIWPHRFSILHGAFEIPWYWTFLALALCLAAVGTALYWVKRRNPGALGFLWALLFLLPALTIPNGELFNESRTYLAFAGVAVFLSYLIEQVAAGIVKVRKRVCEDPVLFSRAAATVSMALFILPAFFWMQTTRWRNEVWQKDIAVWQEVAAQYPEEQKGRYNFGVALAKGGRVAEATREFQESIRLNPVDDMSYAALGYCAELEEDRFRALESYRKASALNPDNEYARSAIQRLTGAPVGEVN